MLENIPLFSAFRLDTVLIPFIQKLMSNQSKSITFMLAHEVLLRWALHQPINDRDEASAAVLLKVLEVMKRCNLTKFIILQLRNSERNYLTERHYFHFPSGFECEEIFDFIFC
jgi:hypothetical protein